MTPEASDGGLIEIVGTSFSRIYDKADEGRNSVLSSRHNNEYTALRTPLTRSTLIKNLSRNCHFVSDICLQQTCLGGAKLPSSNDFQRTGVVAWVQSMKEPFVVAVAITTYGGKSLHCVVEENTTSEPQVTWTPPCSSANVVHHPSIHRPMEGPSVTRNEKFHQ